MIPRHAQRRERLQRIHQAEHVRRTQLRLDEGRQGCAHREACPAAHVIVVQKNREQPHVVARRFELFVRVGADRPGRAVGGWHGATVQLHELKALDRLRLTVFDDLEIALPQVRHRVAVPVGDDDVDADEVDARLEQRLLSLVGRRPLWIGRRRRRRLGWLLSIAARPEERDQENASAREGAKGTAHTSILDRFSLPKTRHSRGAGLQACEKCNV